MVLYGVYADCKRIAVGLYVQGDGHIHICLGTYVSNVNVCVPVFVVKVLIA